MSCRLNPEEPTADRNSTTSFLTAATLIYTIGAGITAAAGTKTCPPIDFKKWSIFNPSLI
jgi:hypothetical protein